MQARVKKRKAKKSLNPPKLLNHQMNLKRTPRKKKRQQKNNNEIF